MHDKANNILCVTCQEAKVKKIMSKKERKDRKMFVYPNLPYLPNLLQRSHKKIKDDEKEKEKKPEKGQCFWDSVTTTMRQISPTKKLEKIEGWEPPQTEHLGETDKLSDEKNQRGDSMVPWRGLEEDNSRYANLSDSKDRVGAVRWTARAKVKLAGIGRMGVDPEE
uniref:Uncharacterized protein n=1 Tax=Periophthalmus magnuspinnatus TaxID=409849 RepID=A0A3B4A2U0_9GOBI